MNSTEEISLYRKIPPNNDEFYSKRGTLPQNYEYHIKEPSSSSLLSSNKKEKKWSLGSLFRRKKKNEITVETSSDEEINNKKRIGGFLGRSRRRKSDDKRRKNKTVGGFDHIVLPKEKGSNNNNNTYYYYHREDSGILSDPNCGSLHQFSTKNNNLMEIESKKIIKGKELIKARAAARRTILGNESSSDNEDDSNNSSLLRVIKSDESLTPKNDDNTLITSSRRSRAARTERYLKRHSRDGENPHNYLRLSKSDADRSPSRSPLLPIKSPIFTIPPNHGKLLYSVSNSTSNPTYKPPLSMNEYNNSFRGDKNDDEEEIIHVVNFPIFRPNKFISRQSPPQPPPRDPNRTVFTQYHDTSSRPNTMFLPEHLKFSTSKKFNNNTPRSSSEQNIPNESLRSFIPLRSASTTPEEPHKNCYSGEENFNYLADKKPRSRKPIFIQPSNNSNNIRKKCESPTQKSLDFWKQIEETVNKTLESPPQIFTSETHVQSQVFLPTCSNHESPIEEKRKSSNLEEALVELEAIYNSLRLGDDENLLDRAEQKENESLMMAKKNENEENRKKNTTKKLSNKIIPNTVDDDMYNRKFVKEKSATISDPQGILSKMSYLINNNAPLNNSEDDTHVIFDDFSYRNLKKRAKTVDSQLPFGIPLNPTLNSAENDYLHAKPGIPIIVEKNHHQMKPIPDIVKDDLAFRNLRKDSNKYPKLDLNYLKKRRAVRSLSANIGTLLMGNDDEEKDSKNNLTNISDAMEIARKVLREKERNLNDTHKAFMSDSDVKFSNGRKLFCDEVINKNNENSSKSSLDDLLNSLTEEAKMQSQRINQELKELDQNNKRIKNEAIVLNQVNFEKVQNLMPKTPPIELKANIVQSCFKDDDNEEHDYENINSDEAEKRLNRKSSFQQCKNELIASFQELKNDIDDLKIPYQKIINNDDDPHRSVYENVVVAENTNNNNNNNNNNSNEGENKGKFNLLLEPLKSPKLVLETSKKCCQQQKIEDFWNYDPTKVAFGLACAFQLASSDLNTVIGILFAVMSFIVAMFL